VIADRWGVSEDEVTLAFPCDEWIGRASLVAWRGVTVRAPAAEVWPWVLQVRLAPYSYDWIDNLGRRSPQILLDLTPPAVGDAFIRAGGKQMGTVLSVDPPHQLTGRLAGAVISYVLRATDSSTTRLLMKLASGVPRPLAPFLSAGDLVMARRQLLNWKRLAEGGG
jgi:hypothetical protein